MVILTNKSRHDAVIGNHVWFAEYAKALKGCRIADNCILGMSCILTKGTFPNSLYVGIPGRQVKSKINWKR